ncbi:MAG TPA: ATP-binding cassette domain-containing protein, partial [Blastocatellia bacterium]|nr:ATP-binding cassette domain-containing protein [Blastocatellia bacterium]
SALSGGEKGRLALAKLIYSRVNMLILDEPTNHLDIDSREALEDALNDFDGSIIAVSHDRYFLDRIASQILFFGEKGVEHFDGGYSEFYDAHHRALAEKQAAEIELQKAERSRRPASAAKPKSPKKSKPKQPSPAEIEAEIHSVEAELTELSTLLSTEDVARDKNRLFELSEKYQTLDDKLAELYSSWEAALSEEDALAAKNIESI